ncbi:MAG: LLM class flavin-dependent oxidoreductase [Chloroflexota bacterium]
MLNQQEKFSAKITHGKLRKMRFGIFDQMERKATPLNKMYQDKLALLELADEAGFWCYFKSEHHLTPLDMSPSTSTWLSAVVARTRNIRVGSLVYLLPFHHPLRLLAEITTLDHLSDGRLEVGVGRGISPYEHKLWGLDPKKGRACFEETFAILLVALTSETLTFRGEFWDFDDVPIEQHPLQKPYPPLWYPGNIETAGARGFNTIIGGPIEKLAAATERFAELKSSRQERKGDLPIGTTQSIGAAVRIILDEDEQHARQRGRTAWKHFDANLTKLWRKFSVTDLPGNPTKGGDFDQALAESAAFAGTPDMFFDFVSERAAVGIDPLVLTFDWGDLSAGEVRHTFDLFVEKVMPSSINL